MWALTSQRERHTSGPENFQPSAKKDFFNTIDPFRTLIGRGVLGPMLALSHSPSCRKVLGFNRREAFPPGGSMRRREFITLLGGAASLPLAAQALQPMPVIGYLGGGFLSTVRGIGGQHSVDAFESGLREMGFVVSQNLAIEYRWAENRPERLPGLVADLVRRQVAVICASSNVTTLAVKKVNSEIPLV